MTQASAISPNDGPFVRPSSGPGNGPSNHDANTDKPPPLRHDSAPADHFCDVVLTGGVTSGVVYPLALLELARHYRFKHIGGTSAGAMAAALAAAAELQRRHGSVRGFEVLRRLPAELAAEVSTPSGTQTRLLSLFQPSPGTARLMNLFLRGLALAQPQAAPTARSLVLDDDHPQTPHRSRLAQAAGAAWALLASFAIAALWGVAVGAALLGLLMLAGATPGWLGALLTLLLAGAVGAGMGLWFDITGPLVDNGFGICLGLPPQSQALAANGLPLPAGGDLAGPAPADKPAEITPPPMPPPTPLPALIDWLHAGIQAAAGRGPLDPPLTFTELWRAPGGPIELPGCPGEPRSIDLRMISTNLSHGRPIQFPLVASDPANALFFHPDELRHYLPAPVLAHLVVHSRPHQPGQDDADVAPTRPGLRRLPEGDLPVLVAARLSLSFPVLFSAVPLWALDEEAPTGQRALRRCWFSDGGLCANFPVHLFDTALPRWPTFGISLGKRSSRWGQPRDAVWLPPHHNQGRADAWNRFDERDAGAARLAGFLGSLLASAKDWHDRTQMRLPGVRDRVVRIGFAPGEGELNLGMSGAQMHRIARLYGRRAGRQLVRRFVPAALPPAASGVAGDNSNAPVPAPGIGWPEHRWVRFNVFTAALRQRLSGLGPALAAVPGSPALADQISAAFLARPLQGDDPDGAPLSAAQADALAHLLTALAQAEAAFAEAATPQPYRATPPPELGLRPPV